eukprot:CAMPEP_0174292794 /NCGR_PEP_ID=MMETSP0809-20121228/36542_1 /TAXON_ID=73025 ORGANISM="Eutreptiella gymnastica-like, Strain CCMP1594" /NCGR_SAMPLE_ID=MMETSP0809 /ASSEMBLY_ACC=CAM_ASM_000658 /LENGTH=35 /DNA_ID= /DNA_START= /DNA_END= /DNA_ORIENTATION=
MTNNVEPLADGGCREMCRLDATDRGPKLSNDGQTL